MVRQRAGPKDKENEMKKTITYSNAGNGGMEKISIDDNGEIAINSDCGSGYMGWVAVTRDQAARCMAHTSAPADVVAAILGQEN